MSSRHILFNTPFCGCLAICPPVARYFHVLHTGSTGNQQFAQDIAEWAFRSSLVVAIAEAKHYIAGDRTKTPLGRYTVNTQVRPGSPFFFSSDLFARKCVMDRTHLTNVGSLFWHRLHLRFTWPLGTLSKATGWMMHQHRREHRWRTCSSNLRCWTRICELRFSL